MRPLFSSWKPLPLLIGLFMLAPSAFAEPEPSNAHASATITLSAQASQQASNDLATASLYHEVSGSDPAGLAGKLNAQIATALDWAKAYQDIEVRSGTSSTYPVYRNGEAELATWRMRSEIQLETRNLAALSELLGKLQEVLKISNLQLQPAPETRDMAADTAAREAIKAFERRAAGLADALAKDYRIRHLTVDYEGVPSYHPPVMRGLAMAAEAAAAPMPFESGSSDVVVTVSGTIELIER